MEEETKKTTRFGESIPIPAEHYDLIKEQFDNLNSLAAGLELMLAEVGAKRNILWKGIREVMLCECSFDKRTYKFNSETNSLIDIGPNPNRIEF
jgi:CRISPR/Cas system-associated endonuclease Cas1